MILWEVKAGFTGGDCSLEGMGGVGLGGNSKGEVIEELGSHPPPGSGS